jgi:hypothetical protein
MKLMKIISRDLNKWQLFFQNSKLLFLHTWGFNVWNNEMSIYENFGNIFKSCNVEKLSHDFECRQQITKNELTDFDTNDPLQHSRQFHSKCLFTYFLFCIRTCYLNLDLSWNFVFSLDFWLLSKNKTLFLVTHRSN